MSLISFLNQKEVKIKFNEEITYCKFKVKTEPLAPPLTENYLLMGTAFIIYTLNIYYLKCKVIIK